MASLEGNTWFLVTQTFPQCDLRGEEENADGEEGGGDVGEQLRLDDFDGTLSGLGRGVFVSAPDGGGGGTATVWFASALPPR